jgi:hypothetical protein
MSFTNPAGAASEAAEQYIAALLALLGDQDPFEVLGRLPAAVAQAVVGVESDELHRAEAPGKWSITQVVQHLADSELVNGYRIRAVLTEVEPAIPGYDQDAWAQNLDYASRSFGDSFDQLVILRVANLELYQSLSEEQLDRWGVHAERGRESVRQLIRLLAAHDLVHLRQIERIKESLT